MRRCFFFLFFLSLAAMSGIGAAEDLDDKQQISFYRGYLLWQECLQRPGMPYDFEQVIAGMKAAESGATFSCDEEKLQEKIREFQENVLAKQTAENLADAEAFLSKISNAGTIPGFAQGFVGMQEGEVRQIFIHPDLAYGTYGLLDPNVLIIFKVEVISADDKNH